MIDFATATLAFTRLRQLLFELSPLFLMDACDHARGLTCFMVGEFQAQHTMGMFMLSEFLDAMAGKFVLTNARRATICSGQCHPIGSI